MIIGQTVEMLEDYQIGLDLSSEMPVGSEEMIVRDSGYAVQVDDIGDFFGCFKQHKLWNEGGVSAVRKLRDEW